MVRRVNYLPVGGKQFYESLHACLTHLYTLKQSYSVFGVVFFLHAESHAEYVVKKQSIEQELANQACSIPFSILSLSLKTPIQLECWISDQVGELVYQSLNGINYTRFTTNSEKSIWIPGITCHSRNWSLQKQIDVAFSNLYTLLKSEGMSLSDIIRQWHYMPEMKTANKKRLHRYNLLNKIRENWFSKALITEGYPAITGVGMTNGHFCLDTIAFQSDITIKKTGLSNLIQPPFNHGAPMMVQANVLSNLQRHPHLLEYAKQIVTPVQKMIVVSGTCVMVGQNDVSAEGIQSQTASAIDYLKSLISVEKAKKETPYTYNYIRVYLKNEHDLDQVKRWCQEAFPEVSITFLHANSCNETLLVELEGEASPLIDRR